ncbi:MAG: hypothetical protein IV090_13605 [Candidatus Sericytochromatia bacterium]|nr:hypothetical protein [Candidatus Sericytochromatia bacterium]
MSQVKAASHPSLLAPTQAIPSPLTVKDSAKQIDAKLAPPVDSQATPPSEDQTSLPANGQAAASLSFLSEETGEIVLEKTEVTLAQETAKRGASKGVNLANQALLGSSSRLGQAAAVRASRALSASVPIAGATISALSAKDDFKRAQSEDKSGHELAALAFGASSALNGFDASLGVLSAGTALTGVGLPVAAVLEVVGWASMGAGLVLGIGGEYLSQKAL